MILETIKNNSMNISFDQLPLDPIVIVLVLLAGLFQKKYLETINLSGAWKTLIVSTIFTLIYALLIAMAGKFTKELPLNCFFSFVSATSLYELFLKKFLGKYFPDSSTIVMVCLLLLPGLTGCSDAHAAAPHIDTTFTTGDIAAQQATTKSLEALLISVLLTALLTVTTGIVCLLKIIVLKKAQGRCQ
jgi:hypothetical protein